MNMRKIIAVLSAVLMLCAIIPMGVFAAPGDVIINKNFDDGSYFSNGSNENGYMVFDATKGDWYNVYLYANAIKSGTKYEITFDAKANKAANMNVKINNNWSGDTFKWTTNVTTEWATYTCVINPDELATLTSTALLMFTSNTTAANGAIYHIDNVVVKEYLDPATIGSVKNGDFEAGNLSGWSAHQSTVISTAAAHSGSYGANLKGNGGWGGMLNQDVPVVAGKSYEVSLWVKAVANGVNVQIKDGGTSGNNLASSWFNKTAWTQLTWTVIPTTDVICFNFCGGGNGVAEDVYVDDIVVSELKDPAFDGYIYNGDFETGKVAPWDVYSGTAVSADAAYTGDYGLYCVNPNGGWGGTANQSFTTEVGKTYVVWMYAKAIAQGQNIQIKDNGTTKASKWFTGTEWTKLSFEYTATSTSGMINICGGGTGANEAVYFDDIVVFEKQNTSNDGYIINGTFDDGALTPWNNLWGSCPKAEVVFGGKDSTFALEVVSGKWKHVRQTNIAVEANTDYKITVWAKNSKNMSLLVKDGGDSKDLKNVGMNAGAEWTQFTAEFNTGDYTSIIVSFMGGADEAYGTFDTVVMEKLHTCNVVEQNRVDADCENDGYIEYACDCGLGAYTETIPATGHNYIGEVTLDPMCDEGLDGEMTYTCENCGDSYVEVIPGVHNIVYVEAKVPANCLETGYDEHWKCTQCGQCYGDAEGSWQINPAWMSYTGECVRPEGAADCATVPCEVCGNDTYGYGEHDVLACQGGTCSKCGEEIEGYGCANYDTPACQDGVCYYCGGFVAGFGHENGSWAACCDGECTYGCGLLYPAAEAHVDEDADDYCDNCWNHLNHDVDPCVGGECSICWTYIEGAHTYDNEFDTDCNACGAVIEIVSPIAKTGASASEDVRGVAARFTLTVAGMGIDETTAIYDNATVNGYKLISMGAEATNGVSTANVAAVYLCDDDVSASATYAIRIKNIPEGKEDVDITFTPYFVVEIDGEQVTVYGEAIVASYADVIG